MYAPNPDTFGVLLPTEAEAVAGEPTNPHEFLFLLDAHGYFFFGIKSQDS